MNRQCGCRSHGVHGHSKANAPTGTPNRVGPPWHFIIAVFIINDVAVHIAIVPVANIMRVSDRLDSIHVSANIVKLSPAWPSSMRSSTSTIAP